MKVRKLSPQALSSPSTVQLFSDSFHISGRMQGTIGIAALRLSLEALASQATSSPGQGTDPHLPVITIALCLIVPSTSVDSVSSFCSEPLLK
jgi:hypothetical protein